MKKISYKILSLTFLITILTTLVPACFQSLQEFDAGKAKLMLGFPFDFYMIKFTADSTFAIHYNIAGFIANIVVTYLIITFIVWVINKIKESEGGNERERTGNRKK